jgi:hypothetical protein
LEDYIFQTGFPKFLRKKAVVINKKPPRTYAWKLEDTKQLFEWITVEDQVVLFVGVYEKTKKTLNFLQESWIHIGERTMDFEQSKKYNRSQAYAFIEKSSTANDNLLFQVYFESTINWNTIRIEFFNREINEGGELAYAPEDSLDVIERCRQFGKKILWLEAFIINNDYIQPQDYISYYPDEYDELEPDEYYKRYHIQKNSDTGHWEEAKQYIRDRAVYGWVFEINYEK